MEVRFLSLSRHLQSPPSGRPTCPSSRARWRIHCVEKALIGMSTSPVWAAITDSQQAWPQWPGFWLFGYSHHHELAAHGAADVHRDGVIFLRMRLGGHLIPVSGKRDVFSKDSSSMLGIKFMPRNSAIEQSKEDKVPSVWTSTFPNTEGLQGVQKNLLYSTVGEECTESKELYFPPPPISGKWYLMSRKQIAQSTCQKYQ